MGLIVKQYVKNIILYQYHNLERGGQFMTFELDNQEKLKTSQPEKIFM